MGWFVLDKYYTLTDDIPVYAAALLLNPSCRLAYLKKNWPEAWHENAINAARKIWEDEFKNRLPAHEERPSSMPPPPAKRVRGAVLDDIFESMDAITSDSSSENDFMNFIQQPPFRITCTPLEWWCHPDQRRRYPCLSQMAIEILSIPPESSEAERTFSGARRTCSWDRSQLTCSNIQMIECIGSWLREGHISVDRENGIGLSMEALPEDELGEIDDETIDQIEWI